MTKRSSFINFLNRSRARCTSTTLEPTRGPQRTPERARRRPHRRARAWTSSSISPASPRNRAEPTKTRRRRKTNPNCRLRRRRGPTETTARWWPRCACAATCWLWCASPLSPVQIASLCTHLAIIPRAHHLTSPGLNFYACEDIKS